MQKVFLTRLPLLYLPVSVCLLKKESAHAFSLLHRQALLRSHALLRSISRRQCISSRDCRSARCRQGHNCARESRSHSFWSETANADAGGEDEKVKETHTRRQRRWQERKRSRDRRWKRIRSKGPLTRICPYAHLLSVSDKQKYFAHTLCKETGAALDPRAKGMR